MTAVVERIEDEHGSHVVPPLDSRWSDLERLQWKAAVTALDSGVTVEVTPADGAGQFHIGVGQTGGTPFNYLDAWTYLNGVSTGAREARRTG